MKSKIIINEKDGSLEIDDLTITADTKIGQLSKDFIVLPPMRTNVHGLEVSRQYAGAYFTEDEIRLKINLGFEDNSLVAMTIYFLDFSDRKDPKQYPQEWLSKKINFSNREYQKYSWGSIGISVDPPSLEGYVSIYTINNKWHKF